MKQTNKQITKTLIMEVWFVLDQYIHDNNLHVLALYPEDSFALCQERDLKCYVTQLLTIFNGVRYTCFYNSCFFGAAGEFTQTNNAVIFIKNNRIRTTHIILFSSSHFKLKQNFNILLQYLINVKFFNFNKKMYDILSIAI